LLREGLLREELLRELLLRELLLDRSVDVEAERTALLARRRGFGGDVLDGELHGVELLRREPRLLVKLLREELWLLVELLRNELRLLVELLRSESGLNVVLSLQQLQNLLELLRRELRLLSGLRNAESGLLRSGGRCSKSRQRRNAHRRAGSWGSDWGTGSRSRNSRNRLGQVSSAGGESDFLSGRVLDSLDFTRLVYVAVLSLDVSVVVSGLDPEATVLGLESESVRSIVVDPVDLTENGYWGRVIGADCNGEQHREEYQFHHRFSL